MTAGEWNTTIKQGSVFTRTLTYEDADGNPINLTDYTARMTLRRGNNGVESLTLSSTASDSAGNPMLTLGGTAGTIVIEILPVKTAALPVATHKYDLELTPLDGKTFSLLEGEISVKPEQTR